MGQVQQARVSISPALCHHPQRNGELGVLFCLSSNVPILYGANRQC